MPILLWRGFARTTRRKRLPSDNRLIAGGCEPVRWFGGTMHLIRGPP